MNPTHTFPPPHRERGRSLKPYPSLSRSLLVEGLRLGRSVGCMWAGAGRACCRSSSFPSQEDRLRQVSPAFPIACFCFHSDKVS